MVIIPSAHSNKLKAGQEAASKCVFNWSLFFTVFNGQLFKKPSGGWFQTEKQQTTTTESDMLFFSRDWI